MNRIHANRPPLRWLVAVSALSLGFAAEHALAGSPGETPVVKVSYADLNLSKRAGAETLYLRIQAAARSVCGSVDSRALAEARHVRQCYDDAIEDALKQVNRSGLYAVHKRKSKARARG